MDVLSQGDELKRKFFVLTTIAAILLCAVFAAYFLLGRRDLIEVIRVVDGDTIVVTGGQKIRLIGINTPESVDPRREVQCMGKEATKKTEKLALGKRVRLERDIEDRDRYGRVLRYVWLNDSEMLNLVLVRAGYAHASPYPPNVKYRELFHNAEKEAREANRGLWKICKNFEKKHKKR